MKQSLLRQFPLIRKTRRWLQGYFASLLPTKASYSQSNEDLFLTECIQKFEKKQYLYIDVGANHPTEISNTYLLYRKGYRGILVEPNRELSELCKRFRPGDSVISAGCGSSSEVLQLRIANAPVFSTFSQDRELDLACKEFVPVLRLDDIVAGFSIDCVNLLSIDVEGLTLQVLEGGVDLLQKTLFVCVECEENEREEVISIHLSGFDLLKEIESNLIFQNRNLVSERYDVSSNVSQ